MRIVENKWVVLLSFAVLWLAFVITYSYFGVEKTSTTTKTFEIVKFIAIAAAVFGAIFSSLLTSFNSLESSRNNEANINFSRTENSFSYMERWDSSNLKEARDISRELAPTRSAISDVEFIQKIDNDQNIKRSVITMWNFFEEIHLSITHNRVNGELLKTAFSETYCNIYERYKAWLHAKKLGTQQTKILDELYTLWKKQH